MAAVLTNMFGDIKSMLNHSREGTNVALSYGGLTVQNQISLIGPRRHQFVSWYVGSGNHRPIERKAQRHWCGLERLCGRQGSLFRPPSMALTESLYSVRRIHLFRQLGQQSAIRPVPPR